MPSTARHRVSIVYGTQAAQLQVPSSGRCRYEQRWRCSRCWNAWAALVVCALSLALTPGLVEAGPLHRGAGHAAGERYIQRTTANGSAGPQLATDIAGMAAAAAAAANAGNAAPGIRGVSTRRSARRLAASGSNKAASDTTTVLPMILQVRWPTIDRQLVSKPMLSSATAG